MQSGAASKHALTFIFIVVLIDMIGLGIIIPVVPELIMGLTGEGFGEAALYGGWLMFLYAITQFVFAPIIGNLSDRFGRRPVLLFSLAAFSLDYAFMGIAPTLEWLFVGRFIAGIAGASHSTANAFIADVSAPEDRAKNFGLIGAAFGLGFILGPVIGGLLGEYGARIPFFVAAGLGALNVIYGALVLPETLAPERRRPFSFARANPIGALAQMRQFPLVFGLLGVMLCYQIAHDSNPSTWSYYTMLKFDWTERDVGFSLGVVGLMIALVQGGLIRVVIPAIGEKAAGYVGFGLLSFGYIGYSLAPASWVLVAFIIPWSLGAIATPAIRGIMANEVGDDAQGELQGAITSLMSLTAIGAPLLMTRLFGFFTSEGAPIFFPGAPFFAAGLLTLLGILQFGRTMRRVAPASNPVPEV